MAELTLHNTGGTEIGKFDLQNAEALVTKLLGSNLRELFPAEAHQAPWSPREIMPALQGIFGRVESLFQQHALPWGSDAIAEPIEHIQQDAQQEVQALQNELISLESFFKTALTNTGSTLTITSSPVPVAATGPDPVASVPATSVEVNPMPEPVSGTSTAPLHPTQPPTDDEVAAAAHEPETTPASSSTLSGQE